MSFSLQNLLTPPIAVEHKLFELDSLVGNEFLKIWHRAVQRVFINDINRFPLAAARADVGWNWPFFAPKIMKMAYLLRRVDFGFVLAGKNIRGEIVPIGIGMGLEPWPCVKLPNATKRELCGYAWYITALPPWACEPLGFPPLGVTKTVVDICLSFSKNNAPGARLLLHSAPKGGDRLLRFYEEKCNMERLSQGATVFAPILWHVNDKRFMLSKIS